MSKVLPRYKAIKAFLLEAIRARTYGPNDRVPTEMELAARFEVSRMTANKAINELVAEGVLIRHQGLGTFVADIQAESSLLELRNIADEIRDRHHVYSSSLHRLEAVRVDALTAMRLGIPVGSSAYHSLIVHKENGTPIQLEDRYVNAQVAPDYLHQDFSRITPNQYLCEAFPLSEIEHVVEAILPDEDEAALLALAPGEPCLQLNRRTWSGGRLISCARLIHPGSRYRLSSRSKA